MLKKLFIQIHDATTPNALPLYLVSRAPFANPRIDLNLNPFESYETLRIGLLNRFGVPESMVPGNEFFEPTAEELDDRDDPIYRTVNY